jgi:hypothetical protein
MMYEHPVFRAGSTALTGRMSPTRMYQRICARVTGGTSRWPASVLESQYIFRGTGVIVLLLSQR